MAVFEPLTPDDVDFAIEKRSVDTFLVVFTDNQGRLQGKRVTAEHFVSEVIQGGIHVPVHLLAAEGDVAAGYGDLLMRPDMSTLHRLPWHPRTIGVLCDVGLPDGAPVHSSPRWVLRRQLQTVVNASYTADVGAHPGFRLFQDTYDEASLADYDDLTPVTLGNGDHSAYLSARAEPLLARIRSALAEVPMALDGTAGKSAPGQFEITLKHADAMRTCDHLVILKNAIKEIAAQEGMSATFMAAYDDQEGNSCHLSLSFRGSRGNTVLTDRYDETGLSEVGKAFVAGQLVHARELTLLYAPNTNSYRRFSGEIFSPSAVNWGRDNRTCAFRLVGSDMSQRLENRIPGSDANPYLATAAMMAAGLDGILRKLPLDRQVTGNGHESDSPALPTSLAEAVEAWDGSDWVRDSFGSDVQAHYSNVARTEIAAAAAATGDQHGWERMRCFESA